MKSTLGSWCVWYTHLKVRHLYHYKTHISRILQKAFRVLQTPLQCVKKSQYVKVSFNIAICILRGQWLMKNAIKTEFSAKQFGLYFFVFGDSFKVILIRPRPHLSSWLKVLTNNFMISK